MSTVNFTIQLQIYAIFAFSSCPNKFKTEKEVMLERRLQCQDSVLTMPMLPANEL